MSAVEVFTCEQRSPEWFAARAGIPTASEFSTVRMKPGPKGGIPLTRTKYVYQIAGEVLTGVVEDSYQSMAMLRGVEQEAEARALYEMATSNTVEHVGFIRHGRMGGSPDGLIGTDGCIEIKTAMAHIQIARLLEGGLPNEHVGQVQGVMLVADRQWCDFVSYCPGLPPLIVRVERDEEYCAGLSKDIADFNAEVDAVVALIKTK
jgi:hypothetical protein